MERLRSSPPRARSAVVASTVGHARSGASDLAADGVQHFLVFGESAGVVLAPDARAVHLHVEDPAPSLDQFRLDAELVLDRFRQTGGLGVVVSLHAIGDADLHGTFAPFCIQSSKRRRSPFGVLSNASHRNDKRRFFELRNPGRASFRRIDPQPSTNVCFCFSPSPLDSRSLTVAALFFVRSLTGLRATPACAYPHADRHRQAAAVPSQRPESYDRFMVIRNSALVRTFCSCWRSSSIDSTTFMSESTRRRR